MNVISASPLAAFVASPSNTPSGSGGGEPGSFDAVFAGLAESVDISDAALHSNA